MRQRLILFAKRPRRGAVKTRLVPPLTPSEALGLYEAFFDDQLRFLRSLRSPGREVELCLDGAWRPTGPTERLVRHVALTRQGPGDLGDRMLRALRRARREGVEAAVIIGVDAPTLPRTHVLEAFRCLRRRAVVVVGPAEDGGYVLIGMTEPEPALFRSISWGRRSVMADTRRRAASRGIPIHEIQPWYDVDDAADLVRLSRDTATPAGRRRAPATYRFLRLLDGAAAGVV